MNILLVYPEYPDTFWSFKHALKFVSKKAAFPPLGLLTVAAMLPEEWEKRVVDVNVRPLRDDDILWADYVFVSAMSVQKESAKAIIARSKKLDRKIVAGGPLFTALHDEFGNVDYLVLNEAEITLKPFLADLAAGKAKHIYTTTEWADITQTPIPRWDLINLKNYASMNLQYSRGCPYDCEFCDITVLYGRIPRTKTKEQVISELDSLRERGWRASVFFVDDNFLGNKSKLKKEILPSIIEWMDEKRHPFFFNTEVSLNSADDEELMTLMARAGFNAVFVGIESPNEESLEECKKIPNKKRDLAASVRKIQKFGMEVQGGFILGFDMDPASIFDKMTSFIQETGIVTAMVGLLNAPRGTKLYKRLMKEGRLLHVFSGDNTDFSMNFIPKMNRDVLVKGYKSVVKRIYSPKQYYERVKKFMKNYNPPQVKVFRMNPGYTRALFKSIVRLGMVEKERVYYWRLFFWSLFTRPKLFPLAITFCIYGFHFRKIFEDHIMNLK
ncbi:MAG TPA: B12-binding domain-containing radical SAM protein [Candidatus Acidoferrales bacterium]|nr:B12-binding domain-containing radical SAM protein [Candidatus Acidoferrales bacterium]